jgi:release factor glutamine methyltransferase
MTPPPLPAMSTTAGEPWTTRRLMQWMTRRFTAARIDSPRIVAEMLLAHTFACERLRLYMEADRPATAAELASLRALVARALNQEPVQYLVGHAWFFGRLFEVSPATLIPRPCTETLVEHVISRWRGPGARPGAGDEGGAGGGGWVRIADVGTGTGCIAVTLAMQIPNSRIIATDPVPEALELANRNASRHQVSEQVTCRAGPGLDVVRAAADGDLFDVICSNPPYIPDDEWDAVAPNVRDFEPASALRGGPDGLAVIRPLIEGAWSLLRPGGLLAIEIPHSRREAVLELAVGHARYAHESVLKDHQGLWRVLVANRAGEEAP